MPVPARRRGAHAAGRHRAARHARAGHRSLPGRRSAARWPTSTTSSSRTPTSTTAAATARCAPPRPTHACCAARPTARGSSPTPPCWPSNYLWYEPYGFGPSPDDVAFLARELGGDAPVDVGLTGGETLRLGPDWRVEVLALPGHTPGHLGLWDPRSEARDHHRRRARRRRLRPRRQPPDPAALLLGRRLRGDHPPPARARPGAAAHRALRRHGARRGARVPRPLAGLRARGARRVDANVHDGTTALWPLTQAVDAAVGPFPAFTHELAASVRAHLARL